MELRSLNTLLAHTDFLFENHLESRTRNTNARVYLNKPPRCVSYLESSAYHSQADFYSYSSKARPK